MTVAIDTNGKKYCQITNSNSDQNHFANFLSSLIQYFEQEDPDWRKNLIITADGARYHKSQYVKNFCRNNDIKLVILSPYSPMLAVCELIHGRLKSLNLDLKQDLSIKE